MAREHGMDAMRSGRGDFPGEGEIDFRQRKLTAILRRIFVYTIGTSMACGVGRWWVDFTLILGLMIIESLPRSLTKLPCGLYVLAMSAVDLR